MEGILSAPSDIVHILRIGQVVEVHVVDIPALRV